MKRRSADSTCGTMKGTHTFVAVVLFLTACGSVPVWKDETPIEVEAIVRAYGPDSMHMDFSDGRYDTTHFFAADLDVVSPSPRFEHRLRVLSLQELDDSNPLTQVGARVTFTVARKYLVVVLSDPKKKHDFPFLYVDSIRELKETSQLAATEGSGAKREQE